MNLTIQIAKQFRDVHFGGNWTGSNLKDNLKSVSWQAAITKIYSFNSIADLVYHMNYYVSAVLRVFQGGPLDAHDKNSFDHSPVLCEEDRKKFLDKTWTDAETLSHLIEQMPVYKLWEIFSDEKYGNYHRNIHGLIEHIHYHLGQIVLIKKILQISEPP